MHNIEPHFKWRTRYTAEKDKKSPFYGRVYSEFSYSQKIYNYFIHPQWDSFGSSTLYTKILFADYDNHFAILEFIGEWNDAVHNDIMFLKREVIDVLIEKGIHKFVLICENVLNFHADDNCYYEEWWDDIKDEDGWIAFINTRQHIMEEMEEALFQYYAFFGERFNDVIWRPYKPKAIIEVVENLIFGGMKQLGN